MRPGSFADDLVEAAVGVLEEERDVDASPIRRHRLGRDVRRECGQVGGDRGVERRGRGGACRPSIGTELRLRSLRPRAGRAAAAASRRSFRPGSSRARAPSPGRTRGAGRCGSPGRRRSGRGRPVPPPRRRRSSGPPGRSTTTAGRCSRRSSSACRPPPRTSPGPPATRPTSPRRTPRTCRARPRASAAAPSACSGAGAGPAAAPRSTRRARSGATGPAPRARRAGGRGASRGCRRPAARCPARRSAAGRGRARHGAFAVSGEPYSRSCHRPMTARTTSTRSTPSRCGSVRPTWREIRARTPAGLPPDKQ